MEVDIELKVKSHLKRHILHTKQSTPCSHAEHTPEFIMS